jgi:hypothetical protein
MRPRSKDHALTAGVMASSQQNAACSLPLADDMACRWRAENAIVADDELLDSIGRSDLSDQLGYFWIPVATISSNDECAALNAFRYGQKDAGDERLAVVWLLKDLDLLSKTRAVAMSEIAFHKLN